MIKSRLPSREIGLLLNCCCGSFFPLGVKGFCYFNVNFQIIYFLNVKFSIWLVMIDFINRLIFITDLATMNTDYKNIFNVV